MMLDMRSFVAGLGCGVIVAVAGLSTALGAGQVAPTSRGRKIILKMVRVE